MITRGFFNISPSVKIRNAPKAALLRRFPHYLFCPSCLVVKALMLGNRAFFATFNPLKVAKGSSAKRFCNLFPCSRTANLRHTLPVQPPPPYAPPATAFPRWCGICQEVSDICNP